MIIVKQNGKYVFPGGTVDQRGQCTPPAQPDPSIRHAALREFDEETNPKKSDAQGLKALLQSKGLSFAAVEKHMKLVGAMDNSQQTGKSGAGLHAYYELDLQEIKEFKPPNFTKENFKRFGKALAAQDDLAGGKIVVQTKNKMQKIDHNNMEGGMHGVVDHICRSGGLKLRTYNASGNWTETLLDQNWDTQVERRLKLAAKPSPTPTPPMKPITPMTPPSPTPPSPPVIEEPKPRTGASNALTHQGGGLGFTDEIVKKNTPHSGLPKLKTPAQGSGTSAIAISQRETPKLQGAVIHNDEVIRSSKVYNDPHGNVKGVAVLTQNSKGTVVDQSTGEFDDKEASERALRAAQMLLTSQQAQGEVVIKGGDSVYANRVYAAILYLKSQDERFKNIKVTSWVSGCSGPEKGWLGANDNDFIKKHLHADVLKEGAHQTSTAKQTAQEVSENCNKLAQFKQFNRQLKDRGKEEQVLKHDCELTRSGQVLPR